MSVGTEGGARRPPPPSSRPPPPPSVGEEEGSDISSSEYRQVLRSRSRARASSTNSGGSDVESELKKKTNDSTNTSSASTSSQSQKINSSHKKETIEERKPHVRSNKVKLLQPPNGLTLMDLDNDLLKRRFKNRAEKFYSPVVLFTDELYTTSSTKYSLVEDKAREIGLVIHINVNEEQDPDSNLIDCERLYYDSKDLDVDTVCAHMNKRKSITTDRRGTLIRYDSKTSEDMAAIICGSYLIQHCDSSVHAAYATLKSKLLSSRKDKMNCEVYLKLVELHDSIKRKNCSSGDYRNAIKNNLVTISLNWIPIVIICLIAAVYFRGILKLAHSFIS